MKFPSWIIAPAMLSGCVINVANSSIGSGNAANNKVTAKADTKIDTKVDAKSDVNANVTTQTNNQVNANVAVNTQVNQNSSPTPNASLGSNGGGVDGNGAVPATPSPSPVQPSTSGATVSTFAGLTINSAMGLDAATGSNKVYLPNGGSPLFVTVTNMTEASVTNETVSGTVKAVAFQGINRFYLTDTKIVKPDGSSVTLSGVPSVYDFAVANDGHAYITNDGESIVYKVNLATGAGSVFAGQSRVSGYADGEGATAKFARPKGIAFDVASNLLYVADSDNHRIRRLRLDGSVTTFAGSGAPKALDGSGTAAAFNTPYDITTDGIGNFYVADFGANKIRKITKTGIVTTIAGSGDRASTDGNGDQASFKYPSTIAYGKVAGDDVLWVGESSAIRIVSKLSPSDQNLSPAAGGGLISNNAAGYRATASMQRH